MISIGKYELNFDSVYFVENKPQILFEIISIHYDCYYIIKLIAIVCLWLHNFSYYVNLFTILWGIQLVGKMMELFPSISKVLKLCYFSFLVLSDFTCYCHILYWLAICIIIEINCILLVFYIFTVILLF